MRVHFAVAMGLAVGRYALLRTVDCRRTEEDWDPAVALGDGWRGVREDGAVGHLEFVG